MNEERVYVSIQTGDIAWNLITSRSQANDFVERWNQVDGESKIKIEGIVDDRDANECENHILKESITGVHIQLIKL